MERKRSKRINFYFSLILFQLQSEVRCCHTRDISRLFLPLNSFYSQKGLILNNWNQANQVLWFNSAALLFGCLRKLICLKTNNAKKKAGKGRAKVTSSVAHVSTAVCQERWQRKRSAAALIPAWVLKLNCEGKPLQWNQQLPLTGRLTPSHAVPPLRSGWLLHFSDRTCYLLRLGGFGSAHKDDLSLWRAGEVPMLTAGKQQQPVGRTRSGNQVRPLWQQLNTGLAQAPHTTIFPLLLHKRGWPMSSPCTETKSYSPFGISPSLLEPFFSLESTPDFGRHFPGPTQLIHPPSRVLTLKAGTASVSWISSW